MQHIAKHLPNGLTVLYAWFAAMHTRVDILLKSPSHSEEQLLEVVHQISRTIANLEKAGNCFNPLSEISAINQAPANRPVRLSDTLCRMLELCRELNLRTGGIFDITIDTPGHSPATAAQFSLTNGVLTKHVPQLRFNLSGFIKGYALDAISPLLAAAGIEDALINLGNSSIMARGSLHIPSPAGTPIYNACLTTSGNPPDPTTGLPKAHIINPLTGQYVHGSANHIVVTASGAEGEALATAGFINSAK